MRRRLASPSSTASTSNHTGAAFGEILTKRGISQHAVARASGVSQPYVNQVTRGKRLASAAWLDLVADALDLDDPSRAELHRAAAKDHGFKIDLSKP